jgi:hypothetical protein
MRRLGIVIVGAAVVAATAAFDFAQQPSATQKAVFALEEQWTRALVRHDTGLRVHRRQRRHVATTADKRGRNR